MENCNYSVVDCSTWESDEAGDNRRFGVGDLTLCLEFYNGINDLWVLAREEIQVSSPDETARLWDGFHIETSYNSFELTNHKLDYHPR